ncbi:MAG: pitrilysin family protein [Crocinitomicaceae bacterium]
MMKKKLIIGVLAVIVGCSSFAQIDRSIPPTPQPNPEININIPEVITLENGLKVIVVENHKLPKVSFQLFVDYPTLPKGDKVGLTGIFGELLASGTETMPKDEFDATVDYMGATVSTNSNGFYASSLKKHTPKLLALLSDLVIAPAFPKDEFDRILKQNLSAIASEESSPASMASNVAAVVNYGTKHPYGEVTTESTLNNIELEDIKKHYSKNFIPNKAYMIVVGDINRDEARELISEHFSEWKQGEDLQQENFKTPTTKGNNVYFVDKPGAVQSQVTITHTLDLKPGHEDVLKLKVLNQILGGGSFSARLMSNLREDKAYTYGCYSRISEDELYGKFSAGGSFRNEVTDSAIVEILSEIFKISSEAVTDKELDLAKSSMTGAFARSLESPQTIARFALNTVRYDLPDDYYANYLTRLEKLTKEDLLAVAKKYLQPLNLNIIVVGNAEISDKLKNFDANNEIKVKDAFGRDKSQLKQAGEGITPTSVIQDFIYKKCSVSSEKELDKFMSKFGYIEKTYKAEMDMGGMTAKMYLTTYSGKPNKSASYVKIEAPQQNMVAQKEWFDGETGGTYVMMQGVSKYEGEELEEKKRPSFPDPQFHYASNEDIKMELLGIDEVDGEACYKLKITKVGDVDFSHEYYSVESGWLIKQETFSTDEEGNAVSTTVLYNNYQEVKKGFMVAEQMTLVTNGQKIESHLENAVMGKKPKSDAFEGKF